MKSSWKRDWRAWLPNAWSCTIHYPLLGRSKWVVFWFDE